MSKTPKCVNHCIFHCLVFIFGHFCRKMMLGIRIRIPLLTLGCKCDWHLTGRVYRTRWDLSHELMGRRENLCEDILGQGLTHPVLLEWEAVSQRVTDTQSNITTQRCFHSEILLHQRVSRICLVFCLREGTRALFL